MLALVGITALLWYFYFYTQPFIHGTESIFQWSWRVWEPDGAYGHCRLVPVIALGLIWMQRHELAALPARGSNWGLGVILAGVGIYLLALRCMQPRFALIAVPFLLFGSVLFIWGWAAAKKFAFPSAFLFFMVPVAFLEQATFQLQFIITGAVGFLSKIFQIGIAAVGTTLTATDGAFNFEIAEGCSGIKSLAAMVMLTAVYVYLTQDRLWKQLLIFACSVGFAIIGNIARIFTVVLVAKFYDSDFAAGLYHDWSGYVFFPIAVMAMLGFAKIINTPFFKKKDGDDKPSTPNPAPATV